MCPSSRRANAERACTVMDTRQHSPLWSNFKARPLRNEHDSNTGRLSAASFQRHPFRDCHSSCGGVLELWTSVQTVSCLASYEYGNMLSHQLFAREVVQHILPAHIVVPLLGLVQPRLEKHGNMHCGKNRRGETQQFDHARQVARECLQRLGLTCIKRKNLPCLLTGGTPLTFFFVRVTLALAPITRGALLQLRFDEDRAVACGPTKREK